MTTVAGGSGRGLLDGPGADAQFSQPKGVAVHPDGSIYVADSGNNRIRRIAPDGSVTTVAGRRPSRESRGTGATSATARRVKRDSVTPAHSPSTRPGTCSSPTAATTGFARSRPTARSRPSLGPRPSRTRQRCGEPRKPRWPGTPRVLLHAPGSPSTTIGNIFFTESNNAVRMIDGNGYVSTLLRTSHMNFRGMNDGGSLSARPHRRNRGGTTTVRCTWRTRITRRTARVRQDHARGRAINRCRPPSSTSPQGIIATPDGGFLVSDPSRERDLEDHLRGRPERGGVK